MECFKATKSTGSFVVTHSNPNKNISCIEGKDDLAVYIQNMCKSYGKGIPVLQNMCMNVKRGTIYALLGSSGCGKTTVLSCIVGNNKCDDGDLRVFGKIPGTKDCGIPGKTLGYMPQELALYNQLSIQEMMQFYGRIYNIPGKELMERGAFLMQLLELPQSFKLVGDLSGGQKRRASLALALIHSPKLLVLDEPTVGLDPLLRINIWEHLRQLVKTSKTTIIITTHYIEEARLSNTIGFMRKGRLLVEDTPLSLLETFGCDLLEKAILQLCKKDDSKRPPIQEAILGKRSVHKTDLDEKRNITLEAFRPVAEMDGETGEDVCTNDPSQHDIFGKFQTTAFYQSSQRVYGMTMVLLLTFIRHPTFICLVILMPSIQGAISIWTLAAKPTGMIFGVVNPELRNWSSECNMSIHFPKSCDFNLISCRYINSLKTDPVIELKPYNSEDDALKEVHLGKSRGFLSFPTDYSEHSLERLAAKQFPTNESIEGSLIHVHLDRSEFIATFFMIKHLIHSYIEAVNQLAESCDISGNQGDAPLLFREPVYGNIDDDYVPFIMPGIIICSLLCISMVLTALMFIADRNEGTLHRCQAAGITTCDVIFNHLITAGIVTFLQLIVWGAVLHFMFGFVFIGSEMLSFVLCVLVGLCGAAMGLLIGTISSNEVEAICIGLFLFQIFLLYTGVVYPMEIMPKFWFYVGSTFPTCLPTKSLRTIMVRGLGLTHPLVWSGFLAVIAWIFIFSFVSYLVIKLKR